MSLRKRVYLLTHANNVKLELSTISSSVRSTYNYSKKLISSGKILLEILKILNNFVPSVTYSRMSLRVAKVDIRSVRAAAINRHWRQLEVPPFPLQQLFSSFFERTCNSQFEQFLDGGQRQLPDLRYNANTRPQILRMTPYMQGKKKFMITSSQYVSCQDAEMIVDLKGLHWISR